MTSRRRLLVAGAAGAGLMLASWPGFARARGLSAAMEESDLIYLTPIRSDGSESKCQGEVWFVHHDGNLYVVTASDAWRARAIERGLTKTRIWVGDVGVWTRSDGAYRNLPDLQAQAAVVRDAEAQDRVLDVMGSKYRMEWFVWGPRFRNGLADGSRVMLRYQPV